MHETNEFISNHQLARVCSMMSPTNNILAGKSSTAARKPQEPAVKCPRCDSPNTKFCYYNNYSLTQPRHFCKTCRRYWTKGGALRNVPIGGGCRKNKRSTKSSSENDRDSGGPSDLGACKFFQGISPAMDFNLAAINNTPRFSNTDDIFNHFSSFANLSSSSPAAPPCFNLESPVTGFSFPLSSSLKDRNGNGSGALGFQEMGSMNIHSNFASSIESLSSINQDLHWKLQQQRMASLFEDSHKENSAEPTFVQKPQPILFQNLESNSKTGSFLAATSTKEGGNGNLSTELFFNNNGYAPATSSSSNWSSGINQAWTELTHFTSLP